MKQAPKRLRYEVLRRDNYTCRYCGGRAPDVTLVVDHVMPVALGGKDEPSNLVAACVECNAGKSSVQPDAPLVADVNADAWRWAQAREAAQIGIELRMEELDEVIAKVGEAWGRGPLPQDWGTSVAMLHRRGLTETMLVHLVGVAQRAPKVHASGRWRYYLGCCWRSLDALDTLTAEYIAETEADDRRRREEYRNRFRNGTRNLSDDVPGAGSLLPPAEPIPLGVTVPF